jgi:hypothetical protein
MIYFTHIPLPMGMGIHKPMLKWRLQEIERKGKNSKKAKKH